MASNAVRNVGLAFLAIVAMLAERSRAQAVDLPARAELKGHWGDVYGLAFSPDGKLLASGGTMDRMLRLWDVGTGKCTRIVKQKHHAEAVSFAPDGKALAVAGHFAEKRNDGEFDVMQVVDIYQTESFVKGTATVVESGLALFFLRFSPDGRTLAIGVDDRVLLWDVYAGRTRDTLRVAGPYARGAALAPDGSRIAISADDNSVRLFDVTTGAERDALTLFRGTVGRLEHSPDGKYLACAENSGVRIWHLPEKEPVQSVQGSASALESMRYSPDGKTFVTSFRDGTIKLYETEHYTERLWFRANKSALRSMAFSPDGKVLATGSHDHTIKLWDTDKLLAAGAK